MGLSRKLTSSQVLDTLIGVPARIGAEAGSGVLDCYSMAIEYLAQTCGIELPRYPGSEDSVEAYCVDIEATMDMIGELLIAKGCVSVHVNYHRHGDIMRLRTRQQYAIADDNPSYLGIDGGNTNCVVASALNPDDPRVRVVPLKMLDILAAYRPPLGAH